LDWIVTVRKDDIEKSYEVTEDRYYSAKVEGISRFLDETKTPGRPWEYISRKRGILEVVVKEKVPTTKVSTSPTIQFYQEKTVEFRKLVREGPLDEDTKLKASGLLLQLQEVFNG